MSDSLRHILDLSDEHWVRLERITGRFEEAWQEGSRPAIEDHLPADPAGRWSALIEMVTSRLEFRLMAGETARRGVSRCFPELGSDDSVVRGLVAAELEARRAREPDAFRDCLSRFPRFADAAVHPQVPSRRSRRRALSPGCPTRSELASSRLREVVGQGAFGIVYRAWDSEARRDVALKILRSDRLASPEAGRLTPPRGPQRGPPRSSGHRQGLRGGPERDDLLPGQRVDPRLDPGRPPGPGRTSLRPGRRPGRQRGRGAPVRAPQRSGSPRLEAVEPPARPRGEAPRRRLRPRQG